MRTGMKPLQRLASVYQLVEQRDAAELQKAMSAVMGGVQALDRQRSLIRSAAFDERQAMVSGDPLDWLQATAQKEIAGGKIEGLKRIQVELDERCNEAKERHASSRLRNDQMQRLLDAMRLQLRNEEERRQQKATDDRFLSRRQWSEKQKRKSSEADR